MDFALSEEKKREIELLLKKNAEFTEKSLTDNLSYTDTDYSVLYDAMRYGTLGSGKRLRAGLLIEFYRAFGGRDIEVLAPVTSAIEMIHAYSLIHDDLPCMDDAELRRGKPSVHKQFGEAPALLAGDALLTAAFALICESAVLTDAQKAHISADMALAAGHRGMIGGQMMDLISAGKNYGKADIIKLLKLYTLKTGYMIKLSCKTGAYLAGAGESEVETVIECAKNIGLAFQLADDLLDMTGDSAETGKDSGNDDKNGKNTLAKIYGSENAGIYITDLTAAALSGLENLKKNGADTNVLNDLIIYISDRKF